MECLGKIGDAATISAVTSLMADESALVRSAAAKAAGRLGTSVTKTAIPVLIGALKDSHEAVRRHAAEAIGELDPAPELLSAIAEVFVSTDARTRKGAILSLLEIDSSRWLVFLEKAVKDPDADVRQAAVAVLGETNVPEAIPLLRERLRLDPDPAVRAEAAYRLRTAQDEGTRSALKRAAETDVNESVRLWSRLDARL